MPKRAYTKLDENTEFQCPLCKRCFVRAAHLEAHKGSRSCAKRRRGDVSFRKLRRKIARKKSFWEFISNTFSAQKQSARRSDFCVRYATLGDSRFSHPDATAILQQLRTTHVACRPECLLARALVVASGWTTAMASAIPPLPVPLYSHSKAILRQRLESYVAAGVQLHNVGIQCMCARSLLARPRRPKMDKFIEFVAACCDMSTMIIDTSFEDGVLDWSKAYALMTQLDGFSHGGYTIKFVKSILRGLMGHAFVKDGVDFRSGAAPLSWGRAGLRALESISGHAFKGRSAATMALADQVFDSTMVALKDKFPRPGKHVTREELMFIMCSYESNGRRSELSTYEAGTFEGALTLPSSSAFKPPSVPGCLQVAAGVARLPRQR